MRIFMAGLIRIACLFMLVCAAVAQSQNPAPSSSPSLAAPAESQTPTFKVTTRLVVVDVVATDHKGNPIKDLKADDFTLEEEKQPQKIRVFSFQDASQMSAPATAPSLPPNRISNKPQFKSSTPLTVILIDGLNTNRKDLIYVKDEMLRMLEKLPAGQPVAIYALKSRLRLLQDFTTDSALLKQAMHDLKSKSAPSVDTATIQSEPFLSPGVASALNEMGMQGMLQSIQAGQRYLSNQVPCCTDSGGAQIPGTQPFRLSRTKESHLGLRIVPQLPLSYGQRIRHGWLGH
jgi:hypothetical protein